MGIAAGNGKAETISPNGSWHIQNAVMGSYGRKVPQAMAHVYHERLQKTVLFVLFVILPFDISYFWNSYLLEETKR